MALRAAYRLLATRLDGHPAVWFVGAAFGVVLGGSYALLFLLEGPFASPAGYALFVLLVAPLFGAALWPYVQGEPPASLRDLPALVAEQYPRLLAARLGYAALLVGLAGALVAVPLVLGTLASLVNYLTGGGATTLPAERARETAGLTALGLAVVGAAVGRVVFGFLDAAALSGGLRGAVSAAFETAVSAPGRTVLGALALLPYRLGLPAVALFASAGAAETRGALDVFVASPRLSVLPADAPSYASPPDPSLAPELLAALVAVDVLLTTFVWPVAFGYHLTLYETLRSEAEGSTDPSAADERSPLSS